MSLGRAVATCLGKYATFSGRASRAEYWWFALFLWLVQAGAGIVDSALFPIEGAVFRPLVGLAMLLPWLAAGWRRMHDTGRSGLHLFYPLIVAAGIVMAGGIAIGLPGGRMQETLMIVILFAGHVFLISPLLVLWWLTRPSEPRANPYGPPPSEMIP